MDAWHPKKIQLGSKQVGIPKEVLSSAGLAEGDPVYVGIDPEDPRTIKIIPAGLFHSWLAKGQRVDSGLDPDPIRPDV